MVTSDELFESIATKLLTDETITRKKMFGSMGLSIGGKVFAMAVKGKLVVKLPRERVEKLISLGRGESFDPGHGRLMKEWLVVDMRFGDEWFNLTEEARNFVALK